MPTLETQTTNILAMSKDYLLSLLRKYREDRRAYIPPKRTSSSSKAAKTPRGPRAKKKLDINKLSDKQKEELLAKLLKLKKGT